MEAKMENQEPEAIMQDAPQDVPQEMPGELAESIDNWRHSVPSRMEREDPFVNDGFVPRPETRVTFREPEKPPVRRPSTRIAMMRAAIPLFRRSNGPNALQPSLMERPETALGVRDEDEDEAVTEAKNPIRGFFALFGRKRKHRSPSPTPTVVFDAPLTLHFLFVGAQGAGQTSLLFRARYGHFPDSSAITRTCYETYTNHRMYYSQPWDGIFLCFDIKDKNSLPTILQWWQNAVQGGFLSQQQSEVLLHLIGMKKDQRAECLDEAHRLQRPFDPTYAPFPTCCVIPHDAMWYARSIGCHRYLECSAKTGEGVDVMIEEAGAEATRRAIIIARMMRMAPSKRRLV
ncbi:P-loop containing nucleoside triphosphate hydrolase protein [Trichoderma camerunense]